MFKLFVYQLVKQRMIFNNLNTNCFARLLMSVHKIIDGDHDRY